MKTIQCQKCSFFTVNFAGKNMQFGQWKKVKTALKIDLQSKYSGQLPTFVACKNCSESAVGFGTQWKPAFFAVKKFAV